MNVELPVEIWLKILSYLPPGCVRNMYGVNHICFELAMDDIYHKLDLINGDKDTLRRVHLASCPVAALRVRSLYIRPSFLPTQHSQNEVSPLPRPQSFTSIPKAWAMMNKLFKVPGLAKYGRRTLEGPSSSEERMAEKGLKTLITALPLFINLEEITIILHNFTITPYFHWFLSKLWSIRGSSIRRLKLDVTLSKIPILLEPLLKPRILLSNLESLSLTFAVSRRTQVQLNTDDLYKMIGSFIRAHKGSLNTLIISQPPLLNLSPLFQVLGSLPHLTRFELPMFLDRSSLPEIAPLKTFLTQNSATLERLVLRRNPLVFLETSSEYDDTYRKFFDEVLPSLSFPALSELDIDSYTAPPYHGSQSSPPCHVFPPFSSLAPKIKKLVLRSPDWFLNFDEFQALLTNLSTSGVDLEFLSFRSQILSPIHLDELSKHLPGLRGLEIIYEDLGLEPTKALTLLDAFRYRKGMFPTRRFDRWALRYIRLSRKSNCGEGHPSICLNMLAASSIPGLKTYDVAWTCFCNYIDSGVVEI